MKKLFMTAMLVAASVGLTNAQTTQRQVVEEGGTHLGASLPCLTTGRAQQFRPVDERC